MIVCIALGVDDVLRGFLPVLIYPGGQGYMESPSRVQLESYYNTIGSFLCTAASSTPIQVVIKKVRYIHELSLTLEHYTSVSSPAAPGLTEPHFDLFHHLFHLKPQPSSARLDVVGGVGIQLRQRMNRVYIPYKLSQKSDRLETKMVLCRKSWKQPSTHPSWPSRSAG